MKEDRPFFPRVIERPLQLFHIADQSEPPLCIRVRERIASCPHEGSRFRLRACREIKQSLRCFRRQMVGQNQQRIFVRSLQELSVCGGVFRVGEFGWR